MKNQHFGKMNSHFKSFIQTAKTGTSTTASISLTNIKNSQYTGQISIGDPQNVFSVIYDTGSANVWINSKICKDQGCKKRKQYDHDRSENYERENLHLDVEFGTGELKGEFSQDTFYFGGIQIDKQDFIEIGEEIGMVFQDQQFDGIIGLAFPSMAAYNKNSIFDNIIQQKKLNKNILSFYMSKNQGRNDSQLTIGGIDKSKVFGQVNYHKVLKDYYWIFKADNILLGGKDVGLCDKVCYLIADTGTSLITAPEQKAFTLLELINVNEDCSNKYQINNLDLTFIVDGHKYSLTPQEYIIEEKLTQGYTFAGTQKTICQLGVMPLDIPNDEDGFQYEQAWICKYMEIVK
ncbi:hypothetical protein IMG5_162980 [Ichthyophthirius multifiliis]|uniref:Peptidase A1 domain-containing protein n=1 Tax=Ichthyophthirius multifiliis TaxID=5932 RepID=G0R0A6_ICHMU|nr:hypothetical protein IMG5_162980 [Ichthyophthirius multifiliis]EGR29114.1 hypothetical protein IMG5_162980 [Ichthyophthirius multifiliis]|eukprot:XP_004030350.1 hypothetical protein IMG5_162980 [Ichthyophthirius multifiliis]